MGDQRGMGLLGGLGGSGSGINSRASSKRRSSFGSEDAMALAANMVGRAQKQGQMKGADRGFSTLGMEVIMRDQERLEHPLISRNLRDLLMVDDRLDSKEMHDKQYKNSTQEEWRARAEAEQKRREDTKAAKEAAKVAAEQAYDEEDVALSPLPPRSPRMRHVRSYRCHSQKELNEFRNDMRKA